MSTRSVDLHGMDMTDALLYVLRAYNECTNSNGKEFDIIHGYGSTGHGGQIKVAVESLCEYLKQLGLISFVDFGRYVGNPGRTRVCLKKRVDGGLIPDCDIVSRWFGVDFRECDPILQREWRDYVRDLEWELEDLPASLQREKLRRQAEQARQAELHDTWEKD